MRARFELASGEAWDIWVGLSFFEAVSQKYIGAPALYALYVAVSINWGSFFVGVHMIRSLLNHFGVYRALRPLALLVLITR